MKKQNALFLPPLLGLAAAALRLFQCRVVFEPDTGLARPHFVSILLPLFLAACAVLFLVQAWKRRGTLSFEEAFVPLSQQLLPFTLAASLLYMVAGGFHIFTSAKAGSLLLLALGALSILCGAAYFLIIRSWLNGPPSRASLLPPVAFLLVWLLIAYQSSASHPVTAAFFVQILAVASALYAFYQVAAAGFGQGSRRMLHFALPLAIVLSLTAVADSVPLALRGMHLANFIALMGFWISEKK